MDSNDENNGPPENPLNLFLLTTEHVDLVTTPATLQQLPGAILQQVRGAAELLQRPYIIDDELYTNLYITSDIHADLDKFDSLLRRIGIVRRAPWTAALGITAEAHVICNTEWIMTETLVIIIGDIVDGRRGDDTLEIPDPKGDIELLLHMYLYNLRIKANSMESELRFTVGNHDFHTVIQENMTRPDFYTDYVHRSAQNFFVNHAGRRSCLFPFYECCPYLMITIFNEVACVHGGFIGYNGATFGDTTPFILEAQGRVDQGHSFLALTGLQMNELATGNLAGNTRSGFEVSPLWSRRYAYGTEAEICGHLNQPQNIYRLTVVGHCQTGLTIPGAPFVRSCCADGQGGHGRAILARDEYTRHNCNRGGCVLVGCRDPQGAPRLAFVDIAMSRAFNPLAPLNLRAEVLHLQHNPALDDDERYYNVIERLNAGGGGASEPVWMAPAPPGPANMTGGRTRRRLKGRARKTKGRRRKTKGRQGAKRRTYKPKRRL
jgi:hypothetical protein